MSLSSTFPHRADSGHLDFFETVTREFVPAYLIVGVYSDSTAAELEGAWPIMSLDERVLSLVPLKVFFIEYYSAEHS